MRFRSALPLSASVAVLAGLVSLAWPASPPAARPPLPGLALTPEDRLLVLAPHPDDEVLGGGGIVHAATALGLPVHIAFLTCGESNLWAGTVYRGLPPLRAAHFLELGTVRRREAVRADGLLGVPPNHLLFLGYPDGEMLALWGDHWGPRRPLRSPFTGVAAVPYRDAYRPGAPYTGESVESALVAVLRAVRPTLVLVSHPADAHPDHRALYLFTRLALWEVGGELTPRVLPYLVHYPGWPRPSRYAPTQGMAPPPGLATAEAWARFPLSGAAASHKLAALRAHRSEYRSDGFFLRRFVHAEEVFGEPPAIDLRPGASAVLATAADEMPGHVRRAERALLVDLRELTVRRDDTALAVTLSISGALRREARVTVDLFAQRGGHPFGNMPKLRLELGPAGAWVEDLATQQGVPGVPVQRLPTGASWRLPLALLGDPERLLVDVRTYAGGISLDASPWRVVNLR